jgi:hypothetical protein
MATSADYLERAFAAELLAAAAAPKDRCAFIETAIALRKLAEFARLAEISSANRSGRLPDYLKAVSE